MRPNDSFEDDSKLSGLCGLLEENVLVDFTDSSFNASQYLIEK